MLTEVKIAENTNKQVAILFTRGQACAVKEITFRWFKELGYLSLCLVNKLFCSSYKNALVVYCDGISFICFITLSMNLKTVIFLIVNRLTFFKTELCFVWKYQTVSASTLLFSKQVLCFSLPEQHTLFKQIIMIF